MRNSPINCATTTIPVYIIKLNAFLCCNIAYASTHVGTMWRCHGCHHMALAQESHQGPSSCQNMSAPELAPLSTSHLRPERASFPADRCLWTVKGTEDNGLSLNVIFAVTYSTFLLTLEEGVYSKSSTETLLFVQGGLLSYCTIQTGSSKMNMRNISKTAVVVNCHSWKLYTPIECSKK